MGNRVNIDRVEFKNLKTGDVSYGIKAYDDGGQTYNNGMSRTELIQSPGAALSYILKEMEFDEVFQGMLEFCRDYKQGLYLDDDFFDYETIKYIISSEESI